MKKVLAILFFIFVTLLSGQAARYEQFIPDSLKKTCKNCKILTSTKANAFNDDLHRNYKLECTCMDRKGVYHTSQISFSNPIQLQSSTIINCDGKLLHRNKCP